MLTNGILGMLAAAIGVISMALLCSWETEESVKKALSSEKGARK